MAYLRINEVAKQLGCSPQAIYQKKEYLLENGMAYIDEKDNLFKINDSGVNYLMEKRKKYLTLKPEQMQSKEKNSDAVIEKSSSLAIEYLERLIEEKERTIQRLEGEIEYYRNENKELLLNQRLLFPKLEDATESQEKSQKKGLFSRLFGASD